jgi:hypothetical protein
MILALRSLGIKIQGNKVNKKDFLQVFGAKYKEPEWMLLSDYKLEVPKSHIETVEKEEDKLGRAILPSSYSIVRFGQFLSEHGDQVSVDGVIYQYSLKGNPRNIRFAYRLFLGVENVAKNSGITTSHSAKQECADEAKKVIDKLFDLN